MYINFDFNGVGIGIISYGLIVEMGFMSYTKTPWVRMCPYEVADFSSEFFSYSMCPVVSFLWYKNCL